MAFRLEMFDLAGNPSGLYPNETVSLLQPRSGGMI